ncbi:MAG TPA: GNAT family N-acetyltransferase [Sphingomonadaceae bacterium]|nr:GNAT family N-acetyltransferase [Sphingomonadaceae bacterium]
MAGLRRDRIETARLVLRRATMADLPAVHAMLSDPKAMRYWSTPPHETLDQSRDWLASMVEADPEVSDDFLIERNGAVIGKLGCWKLPSIGFLLHSDHQRQGYGSEAMAAFLSYLAWRAPLTLTADVDPRNAASLALLTRHGFAETHRAARTWHIGGEWCDSVYLARDL